MSQIIINVGAIPDDGQGDPLRTAFSDINTMFSEVYAAGPVASNIQIANNSITTTVLNSNLILEPSGIGRVVVNNSILPSIDNVYDIGSPTRRFNTIYIGTGDFDIAGTISTSGNVIANNFIGNGSQLSNVGPATTFSSTPPPSPKQGDIWIDSDTAIQYIYFSDGTGNQWAEMEAALSFSNGGNGLPGGSNTQIQFNDNGYFGGVSDFLFDKDTGTLTVAVAISTGGIYTDGYYYANGQPFLGGSGANLLDVGTDIVPSINANYGLGTTGRQWKNLWLSGGNLYINNVPLTTSGNTLQINGANVLTDSGVIDTGNVEIMTDVGNIVFNGASTGKSLVWDFSEQGFANSFITAGSWKNYNHANIVTNTQGPGPARTWNFGTDGTLTLPGQLLMPIGLVSVGGNITGENFRTAGLFSTSGNVVANNVTVTRNITLGALLSAPQQTKLANSTGSAGQICWDANYIYVCTATDTWKRVALTGGY
jgi:hypothetical protein